MRIRFLEIAQIELDEAIKYYNYEVSGLGEVFLTEVSKALDRIGRFPEAWHPAQSAREGVAQGGSLSESFSKFGKMKSWWSQLRIFTRGQTIGRIV